VVAITSGSASAVTALPPAVGRWLR
jgi:hypothetical protein